MEQSGEKSSALPYILSGVAIKKGALGHRQLRSLTLFTIEVMLEYNLNSLYKNRTVFSEQPNTDIKIMDTKSPLLKSHVFYTIFRHMYVCVCVRMGMCVNMCMCVCVCVYVHEYMCICV